MAVSQVILVLYQSDLGVPGGIVAHDARGAVGGAVVDDEGFPLRRRTAGAWRPLHRGASRCWAPRYRREKSMRETPTSASVLQPPVSLTREGHSEPHQPGPAPPANYFGRPRGALEIDSRRRSASAGCCGGSTPRWASLLMFAVALGIRLVARAQVRLLRRPQVLPGVGGRPARRRDPPLLRRLRRRHDLRLPPRLPVRPRCARPHLAARPTTCC